MKKTALIIALAAGSMALAGCDKKADDAAPVAEATSEAAAAVSEAAPASSEDGDAAKAAAPAGGEEKGADDGDGKGNDVKT
jgi:hypothetical protein